MKKIQYLVKVTPKLEYAECLISGGLYMNAAAQFNLLGSYEVKQGQGDIREGAVSHKKQMYKNTSYYIYCMTTVFNDEIENNKIKISKKMIDDFNSSHGYCVIIDYNKFLKALNNLNRQGYALESGTIDYHIITDSETIELLVKKTNNNLFIKHPYFSYQREYRILICQNAAQIFKNIELDGESLKVIDYYEPKIFKFSVPISDFSFIRSIDMAQQDDKYVYLKINDIS